VAWRQRHGDGGVRDLGRAVVGHVADGDAAAGAFGAANTVIARAHADRDLELRESCQRLGRDGEAQRPQLIRLGAEVVWQFQQAFARLALEDAHALAADTLFEERFGLEGFGFKDVHG
jgi:hypothetical protein